jgi:hypothetical protein
MSKIYANRLKALAISLAVLLGAVACAETTTYTPPVPPAYTYVYGANKPYYVSPYYVSPYYTYRPYPYVYGGYHYPVLSPVYNAPLSMYPHYHANPYYGYRR